jgi:UDP-galactopyranose mutase
MNAPVLLVFSHLRWDFVFQRPQHLLTRLAERWHVLFVEEPMPCSGSGHLQLTRVAPRIDVLVPYSPVKAAGFHDDQIAGLQRMLRAHLRREGLRPEVTWLYTPMALPLAEALGAHCLVYDCMDELSAFMGAPLQLRQRESALFKRVDLVLTGGPSLYQARRDLHPHVYCVPSSVDVQHYAPAQLDPDSEHGRAARMLQGHLPAPRLGYFGVLDERIDLALVARLADAHADWQIVMAGPVAKIDPASLPQRANLHWLGMQPYARLPHLLAGWDVALMPFALNEATRHISPTKTLEYLAGEKPVVSTAIADVIGLYGHAVEVAVDGGDFVHACERVLAENEEARCRRMHDTLATVALQSWDHSARCVLELVVAALARADRRENEQAAARLAAATAASDAATATPLVAAGGAR